MSIFDSVMMDGYTFDCVLMERVRVPDGLGGSKTTWQEGMTFPVAFAEDTSTEATIAEQQGFTAKYTAHVGRDMEIHFHDVIKRVEDGKIFRVTDDGDDKKAPPTSTLRVKRLTLERWELPDD